MPKERLAELAKRRRQDLEALKFAASGLVESVDNVVQVTLTPNHPEPIKFQALKLGLREILPESDLRSADSTLRQIAAEIKPGQQFNLPGARALISSLLFQ
jgi:hypothetical protein